MDDDGGGVVSTLMGIFEADAPAPHQGRLMRVLGALHNVGEPVGGDGLTGGAVDAVNLFQQLAHTRAMQCREIVLGGEIEKRQFDINLPFDQFALFRRQAVPFVQPDNQAAPGFHHLTQ